MANCKFFFIFCMRALSITSEERSAGRGGESSKRDTGGRGCGSRGRHTDGEGGIVPIGKGPRPLSPASQVV